MKYTEIFGIPYLEASDPAREIADVSEYQARGIEQVLSDRGELPPQAELLQLLQRMSVLEAKLAPQFIRVGLSGDWNQTANGDIPFRTTLLQAGDLVRQGDGIRVTEAGFYTLSVDSVVQQASADRYRNVTFLRNGVALDNSTFSAPLNGTNAYIGMTTQAQLEADDVLTVTVTGDPRALPSLWLEARTRFSAVLM